MIMYLVYNHVSSIIDHFTSFYLILSSEHWQLTSLVEVVHVINAMNRHAQHSPNMAPFPLHWWEKLFGSWTSRLITWTFFSLTFVATIVGLSVHLLNAFSPLNSANGPFAFIIIVAPSRSTHMGLHATKKTYSTQGWQVFSYDGINWYYKSALVFKTYLSIRRLFICVVLV